MNRELELYHVGLKVLLRNGNSVLFLKSPKGTLDLPGGRIDKTERETPLKEILQREISEELGTDVKYTIGSPLIHFRRHFKDDEKELHIFLTVYDGEYRGGDIKLSDEHSEFLWINPKEHEFRREEFFHPEEFDAINDYFQNGSLS